MTVQGTSSTQATPVVFESEDNSSLSESEKQQFVKSLCDHLGVTEEVAKQILSKMKNSQVRTYVSMANGDKGAVIGMLDPEVQEMLGYDPDRGVYGNPFGDMFIHFLILNYSLGIDIRKLTSQLPYLKLQESLGAAKDRLDGAIIEFACAMMSAAMFIGFGVCSFAKIRQSMRENATGKTEFNPYHPKWQWLTPPTANALAGIFTAGGGLGKALEDYKAAVQDGNVQLMESAFQQLLSALQAQADADRSYYAGL
ncbi:MAG TPA: hypothetical protein VFV39_01875 [Limnobacter sp.]|nr:hypothetical protein [Limnobacter sp.]